MTEIILIEKDDEILEALKEKENDYKIKSIYSHNDLIDFLSDKKTFEKADLYIISCCNKTSEAFEALKKLCSVYYDVRILFVCNDENQVSSKENQFFYLNCYNFIKKPLQNYDLLTQIDNIVAQMKLNKGNLHIITLCHKTTYNLHTKELLIDGGGAVELTKQEQQLLDILSSDTNRYFSTKQIESSIWDDLAENTYLRQLVSRLRKKIPCKAIINKPGKGYKLYID